MLCMKKTTRLYKTENNAHHGVGALRRYGWQVSGKPIRLELAKGKVVWEVEGVRPVPLLVKLYDFYVAARRIVEKVLAPVEQKRTA